MSHSDSLRRELNALQGKLASLTTDLSKHLDVAGKASATANKKRGEAARTKSDPIRRSALSSAEREDKKESDATKKAGDVRKKISDTEKSIGQKRTSLASAERQEQQARDRAEASRQSKERAAQQVKDRESKRRQDQEKAHARELARLSQPQQVRFVEVRPPEPKILRVLYLTANPDAVETTVQHPDGSIETTGVWLRVDFEVRQVKDMLKRSKYRDLVTIEHVPAATKMDILEGLNDHRPHVVHFSGHASSWGLVMDNETGTERDEIEFSFLARILGATDEPPRLVVLNACESLDGADELLTTVPTVIGMSDSINDASAVTFAARFYSGLASAQSVASSVEQAKVAMIAGSLDGSELPEIRTREGVDPSTLVLVDPPNVP